MTTRRGRPTGYGRRPVARDPDQRRVARILTGSRAVGAYIVQKKNKDKIQCVMLSFYERAYGLFLFFMCGNHRRRYFISVFRRRTSRPYTPTHSTVFLSFSFARPKGSSLRPPHFTTF